ACLRFLGGEAPRLKKASDAASAIIACVTRAVDIIDRVRSLYRRDTPERGSVNVNEIIREMTDLLRNTPIRNPVAIHTKLDVELPAARADRVQLQQVLLNLMLNGIEAMKDKRGELTVASARGEDGHLLVSVSDSGVGLPAGENERLFEAFFTTKPQGSGMGLSITRRIIQPHARPFSATPHPHPPATFMFTLPASPADHSG